MLKKGTAEFLKDHHRILIAIAINIVICFVCTFFLVPEVINNDDYIIQSITSGAFGASSPELAHTNWIYGNVLVALQQISPDPNWFEILNYMMIFISSTLITCVIWLQNRCVSGFFLALAFSLFISPDFYNGLHNSKEIPFIAAACLFSVLFGVKEKKYGFCVLGGIVALLASWVRFHAFLVGAAFAFGSCAIYPLQVLKEENNKKWLKEGIRLVLVFSVVFLLILGTWFVDIKMEDATTSLNHYRDYNAARGAVSDYELADYSEYYAQYAELLLSENDYEMIQIWDFADSEKFTTEMLLRIAQIRDSVTKEKAISRLVNELLDGMITNPFQIAFGVMFILALIMTHRTEKNPVLWMGIAFIGCYYYMCMSGRTTHWVTSGMIAAALTGVFVSIKWKKSSLSVIFSIVILLAVLIFDIVTLIPQIADYNSSFNKSAGQIYTDLGDKRENLYLMDHNSAPPLQRIVPTFSSVQPDLFRNIYILGGWDTESYAKNSVLERYQVFGSPYRALIEKRNVFLADTQNASTILKYVRENYAPNATMALQETIDGYNIYAFTNQAVKTDDTSIKINDAAVSIDTAMGSFLYVGVIFDCDLDDTDTVYVSLTNPNSAERIYRAATMDRNDGKEAAVLWVPITDWPQFEGLSIRVIVESESGMLAGSEVFLSS